MRSMMIVETAPDRGRPLPQAPTDALDAYLKESVASGSLNDPGGEGLPAA